MPLVADFNTQDSSSEQGDDDDDDDDEMSIIDGDLDSN